MRKIKLLLISTYIITNISLVNAQNVYTGVFKTTTDNADYHHFTRSHVGGAAVYINQVSTGPILRLSSGIFDANQNVKFTVENNGNVGIGTTDPEGNLDIYGNEFVIGGSGSNNNPIMRFFENRDGCNHLGGFIRFDGSNNYLSICKYINHCNYGLIV